MYKIRTFTTDGRMATMNAPVQVRAAAVQDAKRQTERPTITRALVLVKTGKRWHVEFDSSIGY